MRSEFGQDSIEVGVQLPVVLRLVKVRPVNEGGDFVVGSKGLQVV